MGKLSDQDIDRELQSLGGWKLTENRIEKEFQFDSYMSGVDFVNRIAARAEEHNHHPDLEVGWCRVKVELTSHDTGGVTERDIRMAKAVSDLARERPSPDTSGPDAVDREEQTL